MIQLLQHARKVHRSSSDKAQGSDEKYLSCFITVKCLHCTNRRCPSGQLYVMSLYCHCIFVTKLVISFEFSKQNTGIYAGSYVVFGCNFLLEWLMVEVFVQ